jgi:hypothetical protein
MPEVTQQALKDRARSLLEAMTERERYMYALDRDSLPTVKALMAELDIPQVEDAAGGSVVRFATESPRAHFVLYDNEELGVLLLQGDQSGCVPTMAKILEATGFVPQSKLWEDALNIGAPEAQRALKILAHMAIGWDPDWTDLFLLHLASPDPIVRHDATLALTTAAMVSFEQEAAIELLVEAKSRETFPKLAATMAEAEKLLRKLGGEPVDLAAMNEGRQD